MSKFRQFLIGYIAAGHTTTIEALEELGNLTDDFLKNLDKKYYYDEITLYDYFDYLKEHMSNKNIGFFHLYFNEDRYKNMLISYLKKYL